MKNKIYTLTLFLLVSITIFGQTSTWQSLGTGTTNNVNSLVSFNGDLIAGGAFTNAGGSTALRVAKWNGSNWQSMGSGFANGEVKCLAVYNGELYAGGSFSLSGSNSVLYIAKWNGTDWESVGNNQLNSFVYCLKVYNAELYAGGQFNLIGATMANGMARWNGSTWSDVSYGVWLAQNQGGTVSTMEVFNSKLYVGGGFTVAGGSTAPNGIQAQAIASWDGSIWAALDNNSGINNAINTMEVFGNFLYIGGEFTQPHNHITRWDGFTYSPVGVSGINGYVHSQIKMFDKLYIGGSFTNASGTTVQNIVQWDGLNYSVVAAGGMNQTVKDLTVHSNELYAGGIFTTAGGVTCPYVAKLNLPIPNAQLSATATTICENATIEFTDVSTNSPTSLNWTFEGGSPQTSTQTTQTVSYSTAGTFDVTLIASNSFGSDTIVLSDYVTVNSAPAIPTISADGNTTFCEDTSVVLTSSSISGNTWSQNAETTQAITVSESGSYTVTVSNGNCSATSIPTIITVNSVPATPTITIDGITTFCLGDSVVLTASSASGYLWSNSATTQSITVFTSDDYSVTVSNLFNCTATSTATTVTANPVPPTPTINQIGSVLVSSSATDNQWLLNGSAISGQTNQIYTVPSLLPVLSCYSALVANSFSCFSVSDTICFPPTPVGFSNPTIPSTVVSIFPNPSDSKFNISSSTYIDEIIITNTIGQIILQTKPNDNTVSLQLSDTGIYFITVKTDRQITTQKLSILQ